MKIIKIENCFDCPHYTVRHPESYGPESHCRIGDNFQEPPDKIPDWCPLEDESYENTLCPECLGFNGHKISCSAYAK